MDWSNFLSIICRSNYCSVSLFILGVGFIGWCGCLRLLFDAGVSAVGTTLLQSPGWNEGKARNETLGKHVHKNKSSVGAALSVRLFAMDRLVFLIVSATL